MMKKMRRQSGGVGQASGEEVAAAEAERERDRKTERERERLRTRQDFTWGWLVKVDANRFSLFTEAVREGIYD